MSANEKSSKSTLNEKGKDILGAAAKSASKSAARVALGLPAPSSAAALSITQRIIHMLPGGASAATEAAVIHAARATGGATGISVVLGAGIASARVFKDVRSGYITKHDAARYVGVEAAKEGAAGFAAAAAISAVVMVSGPVGLLAAVAIGFGAATAARMALPKTPAPKIK